MLAFFQHYGCFLNDSDKMSFFLSANDNVNTMAVPIGALYQNQGGMNAGVLSDYPSNHYEWDFRGKLIDAQSCVLISERPIVLLQMSPFETLTIS